MKVGRITAFGTGILIAAISFSPSLAAAAQTGIASVTVASRPLTANMPMLPHSPRLSHLPFGTMVMVTNTQTDRSVVVRMNDRGPYIRGRVIDLTPAGARAIGSSGLAQVSLTVLSVGTRGASRSVRSTEG